MSETPEPYDAIFLDAGGDDLIVLRGPLANPQEVAKVMEDLRMQRSRRLKSASPAVQDAFVRWQHGREPLYFRRSVNANGDDLTIYVSAPALREALTAEINLGASPDEIGSFTNMSLAGMIYGSYYSQIEPDGEPGSCHICDLVEITEGEFHTARKAGWP